MSFNNPNISSKDYSNYFNKGKTMAQLEAHSPKNTSELFKDLEGALDALAGRIALLSANLKPVITEQEDTCEDSVGVGKIRLLNSPLNYALMEQIAKVEQLDLQIAQLNAKINL